MQPVDFYGNVAFSLNRAFQDHAQEVFRKIRHQSGRPLTYHIPTICDEDCLEQSLGAAEESQLPSLLATIGFEGIFQCEFERKYLRGGVYHAGWKHPMNSLFARAGLEDPEGVYGIHAVTPYVFLVNHARLAGRPVPRRWEDLLNPIYEDSLIVNGSRQEFSYIFLLYMHKAFGLEGLAQLACNIMDARHAAEIVHASGQASGAAIAVLPWLFAQCGLRSQSMEVVWPEDGAIVSPMFALMKTNVDTLFQQLTDDLFDHEFAKTGAQSCFPSARREIDNRMPRQGKLKWLGWDYIREHPVQQLKAQVCSAFLQRWAA